MADHLSTVEPSRSKIQNNKKQNGAITRRIRKWKRSSSFVYALTIGIHLHDFDLGQALPTIARASNSCFLAPSLRSSKSGGLNLDSCRLGLNRRRDGGRSVSERGPGRNWRDLTRLASGGTWNVGGSNENVEENNDNDDDGFVVAVASLETVDDLGEDDDDDNKVIFQGEQEEAEVGGSTEGDAESDVPNIAFFYLQNTVGLDENVMWKVTNHAGSSLRMTVANLQNKVATLQESLQLTSDDEVRQLLSRQPSLLHLSAEGNLRPTIEFIRKAFGFKIDELRSLVLQNPSVLTYSMANLKSKQEFFQKDLKLSKKDSRRICLQEPKLLSVSVEQKLRPCLDFLTKDDDGAKMEMQQFRSMILTNPRVLKYSRSENIQVKLNFLRRTLELAEHQLGKFLYNFPQFFDYHLHRHILPLCRYLYDELNFSRLEVKGLLVKHPRLLRYSVQRLEVVVAYLQNEKGSLQLDEKETKRVMYQVSRVVGLHLENTLQPKLDFLQNALHLSTPQLRKLVVGMPTLLTCSLENNLKPKMDFMKKEVYGISDMEENDPSQEDAKASLRAALLSQPALLGYSLEGRMRPRWERICETLGSTSFPDFLAGSIHLTEANFEKWLNRKQSQALGYGSRRITTVEKSKSPGNGEAKEEKEQTTEERKGRIVHWRR